MVVKRQCSFCANEIEPGTGTMFVKRDGTVFHFCSSSCRKQQLHLGRVGHRHKWTRAHAMKRVTAHSAPRPSTRRQEPAGPVEGPAPSETPTPTAGVEPTGGEPPALAEPPETEPSREVPAESAERPAEGEPPLPAPKPATAKARRRTAKPARHPETPSPPEDAPSA